VAPDSRRLAYGDPGEVTGRLPGETNCLTLVWAVLDLYITHATNGIKFTQSERQQLKHIKDEDPEPTLAKEVTADSTDQHENRSRGEATAALGRNPEGGHRHWQAEGEAAPCGHPPPTAAWVPG
jgi:hypothetical protein